jgi:GNAT superfamily N-acetyltransferase
MLSEDKMDIRIRPAIFPQDFAAIADVLRAESPEWGATAEELAHEHAQRDPRYHHATFVADDFSSTEPFMVGVGFVGHDTLAHQDGLFNINLRVHPDWQGRGVGKALYQAVLDHLAPYAPRELTAMAWHTLPRPQRFLTDRGFVETWRRVDSYMDTAAFDLSPYNGLAEQLRAQDITITTYTELAADPDRLVKLHALDSALWEDVPYGQSGARRTLAQFAADEVNHPEFLHDACFIAVIGGRYIGYSNLVEGDEGYTTSMTGVLPPYRRMGLATLLKLCGIRYARAHGNRRLWTVNDSVNESMLGLNHKLGFVYEGANIRFVKNLESNDKSQT